MRMVRNGLRRITDAVNTFNRAVLWILVWAVMVLGVFGGTFIGLGAAIVGVINGNAAEVVVGLIIFLISFSVGLNVLNDMVNGG